MSLARKLTRKFLWSSHLWPVQGNRNYCSPVDLPVGSISEGLGNKLSALLGPYRWLHLASFDIRTPNGIGQKELQTRTVMTVKINMCSVSKMHRQNSPSVVVCRCPDKASVALYSSRARGSGFDRSWSSWYCDHSECKSSVHIWTPFQIAFICVQFNWASLDLSPAIN